MRAIFLGLFSLCCIAIVNCALYYEGPSGNKHIYAYDGVRYEVTENFYRLYQTNPREAEHKLIADIANKRTINRLSSEGSGRPQNPSFLGNKRPESSSTVNKQDPTREEISNSQAINSFKPNKIQKPEVPQSGSAASDFHFPQPGSANQHVLNNPDTDTYPAPDTGFNREIPREREREEYKGTAVVSNFAWNLFKNSNTKPNFVIGTLSPQILLSYLAWVADGSTRNELIAANGFGSPNQIQTIVSSMLNDGSNKELQIATAFFVSHDMRINQEFLDKSIEFADLISVDFRHPESASRTISKWAKSKTKGGLRLKEINYAPATKMALTSAMYFKGKWVYTFEDARPGTFFTKNGPVEASMMNMKRKFRWAKLGNFAEWVAIPYESSDSLVIILPNKDQNVENVINMINGNDIDGIMRGIDSESTKANVNITLPKFRLESTTSLVEPLKKMGVSTLFTPQADLSYLSDYDTVQVNNAQQQASMEVNEQGTVFVAFTNLNVVALSFQLPVPDVEFNVNRPFIAMIANTKKNIPFVMAKISNPSA